MSQRVIDKIRKILNIANDGNATDAEIETAMGRAAALMERYHLSEEDLETTDEQDDFAKVDNANFDEIKTYLGSKAYAWEKTLASFVGDYMGLGVFMRSKERIQSGTFGSFGAQKYGRPVVFYGVAEDAALAVGLYQELRQLISTMAFGRYGSMYKGDGGVYAEGFVSGLRTKLKSDPKLDGPSASRELILRRQNLVAYKHKAAKNWIENKGYRFRTTSSTGARGSNAAYSQGRRDGANTDVETNRRRKLA